MRMYLYMCRRFWYLDSVMVEGRAHDASVKRPLVPNSAHEPLAHQCCQTFQLKFVLCGKPILVQKNFLHELGLCDC